MFTLALLMLGAGAVNATKLYATYGTPASEGSWDAETHVYSWTNITSGSSIIEGSSRRGNSVWDDEEDNEDY